MAMGQFLLVFSTTSAAGASGARLHRPEAPAAENHWPWKQRCSETRTLSCPAQSMGVRAGDAASVARGRLL